MGTNANMTAGIDEGADDRREPRADDPKRAQGFFQRGPIGLVVVGLHVVLIYAIAGSLGIVKLPEFAKPMEAVIIDSPPEQQHEPVPIVKPDLETPHGGDAAARRHGSGNRSAGG